MNGEDAVTPFTVYEMEPVPPVALNCNSPLLPLHNASIAWALSTNAAGSLIVTIVCIEH